MGAAFPAVGTARQENDWMLSARLAQEIFTKRNVSAFRTLDDYD